MDKLYELADQYNDVSGMLESDEVSEQAVIDTLESIEGEISKKAANIVAVIENMNSSVPAIDAQIARLQTMKRGITEKQAWLNNYLLDNMQRLDMKKIECPLFKITRIASKPMVNITDSDALPDEYVATKVTIQPDKRLILKDLKEGKEIKGAEITQSKEAIKIS